MKFDFKFDMNLEKILSKFLKTKCQENSYYVKTIDQKHFVGTHFPLTNSCKTRIISKQMRIYSPTQIIIKEF